jgi:CRP/FNR family transcriptional regulator, nitrogen oxide reductase regulator
MQEVQEIIWSKTPELFVGLTDVDSKYMEAAATVKTFSRGDMLFFTGDVIDKVLLLVDGCVKITQTSGEGKEFIIRVHGPGEVIGELTAWYRTRHSSTAQALQPCTVLVWNPTFFREALERAPGLGRNASDILKRRLSELELKFGEISTATAAPRLAFGLRILLPQMGQETDEGFEINISQEELGQLMAVDAFEVCRVLRGWEQQGLVRLRRGAIVVKCASNLQDLCRVR